MSQNTLGNVKLAVRSVVGDDDPNGWLNDSYLTPKINLAYGMVYLYLKNATGTNLEAMVEIPNATDGNDNSTTQGLTSLAAYQQPGKLLDGLYEPMTCWWKPAGASELCYRELKEKKTILPGQSVTNQTPTSTWWGNQACFTWRGNTLYTSPISFPVDICVDGKFNPPALTKDADVLVAHPDIWLPVISQTVAIIGTESGNVGYQQLDAKAEQLADNIVADIVRGKQGYTSRAGRMAGRRACGWYWGNYGGY